MAASKSPGGSNAGWIRELPPERFASNVADTVILCESGSMLSKFNYSRTNILQVGRCGGRIRSTGFSRSELSLYTNAEKYFFIPDLPGFARIWPDLQLPFWLAPPSPSL